MCCDGKVCCFQYTLCWTNIGLSSVCNYSLCRWMASSINKQERTTPLQISCHSLNYRYSNNAYQNPSSGQPVWGALSFCAFIHVQVNSLRQSIPKNVHIVQPLIVTSIFVNNRWHRFCNDWYHCRHLRNTRTTQTSAFTCKTWYCY